MRLLLLLALLLSPVAPTRAAERPAAIQTADTLFFHLVTETCGWFSSGGIKRKPEKVQVYLASAYRVANMIDGFPGKDREENAVKYFCWGAIEGTYLPNYVNANIPGTKLGGGVKGRKELSINRFSIDFGWIGLNQENVTWTYQVAKLIQSGKPWPKDMRTYIHPKALKFYRENIHIPADMKLKAISLADIRESKTQWKRWNKAGKDPRKFSMAYHYKENSPDDLDSVLIYRILVEVDRKYRGWNHSTWHPELYAKLNKIKKSYD